MNNEKTKIYKMVGSLLIVMAILSAIFSYVSFTSSEKDKALANIGIHETFREEYVKLRTSFRNLGNSYKAQECQDKIDEFDSIIKEKRDVIAGYNAMGTILAIACVAGLATGIGFFCASAKKQREECSSAATQLEND